MQSQFWQIIERSILESAESTNQQLSNVENQLNEYDVNEILTLENPDQFLAEHLEVEDYPMGYKLPLHWRIFDTVYYNKLGVEPGEDEDIDVLFMETLMEKVWEHHPWWEEMPDPPLFDLEKHYPYLYRKMNHRGSSNLKVYKTYGGMGDEGSI